MLLSDELKTKTPLLFASPLPLGRKDFGQSSRLLVMVAESGTVGISREYPLASQGSGLLPLSTGCLLLSSSRLCSTLVLLPRGAVTSCCHTASP